MRCIGCLKILMLFVNAGLFYIVYKASSRPVFIGMSRGHLFLRGRVSQCCIGTPYIFLGSSLVSVSGTPFIFLVVPCALCLLPIGSHVRPVA